MSLCADYDALLACENYRSSELLTMTMHNHAVKNDARL